VKRLLLALGLIIAAVTAVPATLAPPAQAQPAPGPITITGVDLHDGMMLKSGGAYYLYGTMYGCGFQWGQASPWCGFGVSTAPSPSGPWSTPQRLFSPWDRSPFAGVTWSQLCGGTGAGCFNPRMIIRSGWGPSDGVPILWFNAPADYNRVGANAYYAMGCNSLTGPCGASAGAPYGSTIKPSMYRCHDNGDFSLVLDAPRPPMMLCTMADQTLASERLDQWGTGGVQGSGRYRLAGATATEAPGAYRDPSGTWIMTFNEPNCGYCAGSGTSFATATSLDGAWSSPSNVGWAAPPSGRRLISGTSCGGQGRTIVELDGQAYQWIDLWLGTANETNAGIHLEPLVYRGASSPLGQPYQPFAPWTCGRT
jgi:hypothetical protein